MPSNATQTPNDTFYPDNCPPGFLDEPLNTSEAAEVANTSTNAMAVDRCRGVGPPYSKSGRKITYTRRDIFEYHRQNRRIPQNNL